MADPNRLLQIGDSIQGAGAPAVNTMGARPNIPTIRDTPVQIPQAAAPAPFQPGQGQEVGGIINFFRSMFHRNQDLNNTIQQLGPQSSNGSMPPNGLRQPAYPEMDPQTQTLGVRG